MTDKVLVIGRPEAKLGMDKGVRLSNPGIRSGEPDRTASVLMGMPNASPWWLKADGGAEEPT